MRKTTLVMVFSGLALVSGLATCAFAGNDELKLNSNDGSTKFAVKDKSAVTIFSADSDGNLVIKGSATIVGSTFTVGGAAFVVMGGNIGIGTVAPATRLDGNGPAQFGSGAAKSTFTTAGALNLAANQNVTLSGTGRLTGLAAPTADADAANKLYADTAAADAGACPVGMAYIPGPYPYCVDKYEAWNSNSGTIDNTGCTAGSQAEVAANNTTAIAGSAPGKTPQVSLTWCAAKKACQNAGKHLLTNMEWFTAANYKGSKWNITAEQTGEAMACNTDTAAAALTGASATCVTQEAVYDMIGNVWEWVDFVVTADPTNGVASGNITGYDFATGVPISTGTTSPAFGGDYYWAYNGGGTARAVLRGGGWGSVADGGVFAFVATDAPSAGSAGLGFRCGRRR